MHDHPGAARWSRGVVEVIEEVFIKNISLPCNIRNYPHIRYPEAGTEDSFLVRVL